MDNVVFPPPKFLGAACTSSLHFRKPAATPGNGPSLKLPRIVLAFLILQPAPPQFLILILIVYMGVISELACYKFPFLSRRFPRRIHFVGGQWQPPRESFLTALLPLSGGDKKHCLLLGNSQGRAMKSRARARDAR